MSQKNSLGVLLPTRNCASRLKPHLAAMQSWLDLADEIVVVDSFSVDGTEELLRRELKHPNRQFISHPPGLYESWNAGLQRLSTEYAYISTVGETITRSGLQQLLEAAETFEADVVISKPLFKTVEGAAVHREWPIDDVIRTLRITSARRLTRLEAMIFAFAHATGALTGSCASDLFRTVCLRRLPFPTEFGTAGDGAWGLQHAAEVSWAVVPGNFSTFLCHPTDVAQAENRPHPDAPSLSDLLRSSTARWQQAGLVSAGELAQIRWSELEAAVKAYLAAKSDYDLLRKRRLPWFLLPRSWRARARRKNLFARLDSRKRAALGSLNDGGSIPPVGTVLSRGTPRIEVRQ
jgi:glycosyltransferase involved in cell wall biosynthesis